MTNENADKNDQTIGCNDDDQGGDIEHECEDLRNILHDVSLSFENVEGMSEEEKTNIKSITEVAEYNLDEEVNGFKKVHRNLLIHWTVKPNVFLKEVNSGSISESDILFKACVIFARKK